MRVTSSSINNQLNKMGKGKGGSNPMAGGNPNHAQPEVRIIRID